MNRFRGPETTDCEKLLLDNDPDLVELYLSDMDTAAASRVASALRKNTILESLHVCDNNILGDVGLSAIAGALENTTIRELFLEANQISELGAIILTKSLFENYTLYALILDDNNLGDVGASTIAKFLETNMVLQRIDLQRNNIGDVGASAIGKALKVNTNLEWLDLANNNIGNTGILAIASGLERNTTLRTLFLAMNNFDDVGMDALVFSFYRSSPIAYVSAKFSRRQRDLMQLYQGYNRNRLVEKVASQEIPDYLFPEAISCLSNHDEHVNKLFEILKARPDLLLHHSGV
jgi:Ran GTPase-activating protein (RanGAP) involved in mRNA processing and transport